MAVTRARVKSSPAKFLPIGGRRGVAGQEALAIFQSGRFEFGCQTQTHAIGVAVKEGRPAVTGRVGQGWEPLGVGGARSSLRCCRSRTAPGSENGDTRRGPGWRAGSRSDPSDRGDGGAGRMAAPSGERMRDVKMRLAAGKSGGLHTAIHRRPAHFVRGARG